MPRLARIVAPGFPHHVTQRGNRRLRTFFSDEDHEAYLGLMRDGHLCQGPFASSAMGRRKLAGIGAHNAASPVGGD